MMSRGVYRVLQWDYRVEGYRIEVYTIEVYKIEAYTIEGYMVRVTGCDLHNLELQSENYRVTFT